MTGGGEEGGGLALSQVDTMACAFLAVLLLLSAVLVESIPSEGASPGVVLLVVSITRGVGPAQVPDATLLVDGRPEIVPGGLALFEDGDAAPDQFTARVEPAPDEPARIDWQLLLVDQDGEFDRSVALRWDPTQLDGAELSARVAIDSRQEPVSYDLGAFRVTDPGRPAALRFRLSGRAAAIPENLEDAP